MATAREDCRRSYILHNNSAGDRNSRFGPQRLFFTSLKIALAVKLCRYIKLGHL